MINMSYHGVLGPLMRDNETNEGDSIHDPNLTKAVLDEELDIMMKDRKKYFKRKTKEYSKMDDMSDVDSSDNESKRVKRKMNNSSINKLQKQT